MNTPRFTSICRRTLIPALLVLSTGAASHAQTNDPAPLSIVKPVVPLALAQRGIYEGSTTILAVVGPEGQVTDWLPIATTSDSFATEIGRVINEWKFSPGHVDGEPVICTLRLQITFRSDGVIVSLNGTDRLDSYINSITGQREKQLIAAMSDLDAIPEPLSVETPKMYHDENGKVLTGQVRLGFFIDTNGNVRIPMLEQLDGHDVLAQSAYQAIQQWKFKQPTVRGRPVTVRAEQLFLFLEPPPEQASIVTPEQ